MLKPAPPAIPLAPRPALRKQLIAQRDAFVAGSASTKAGADLSRHLAALLSELEPGLLGLYWPLRSEFNAVHGLGADTASATLPIAVPFAQPVALPFAQRAPAQMHYRAWDGAPPEQVDDCGIPCSDGARVTPDVVLVPCLGFTRAGFRLGYGGGFFDRWLAQHPGVTAVGVAWAVGEIAAGAFEPQPHDQPMTLIVTEHGVL